ncbi:MAG TPA: diacylglycerol kinase family lipid kinase [Thermoanaerobaculaceae bacterium]|nr:diacylglycerol kinase family lipid kinase [Thermoanaerobaculaceae bacterium]
MKGESNADRALTWTSTRCLSPAPCRLQLYSPRVLDRDPAAGGGRLGREWPRLRVRLTELGLDFEEAMTRAPGHATELAGEAAIRRQHRLVVAVGGDGTICEVVQGLHAAGGATLEILPVGTGNDTARTLGLPVHLEEAVGALRAETHRRVDLMSINGQVVVNAAGVGLLGSINAKAAGIKIVRGIFAYLVAAVASVLSDPTPEVEVEADDFHYRGPMTILALQNGPTTGGGFALAPEACSDDGFLDACLVGNVPIAGRFSRLAAALRGRLGDQPGSHMLRFKRMGLRCQNPIHAHLDGNHALIEPPGMVVEVLPGALDVIAPAAS